MNQNLQAILLEAAHKALGAGMPRITTASPIRKAGSVGAEPYAAYDVSLREFYIPGHTRREEPSEEQKMVLGLRMMVQKLQKALIEGKEQAYQKGLADGQKSGETVGYEKGRSSLQAALATVQQSIASVLKSFESKKLEVLNNSERKTLEIVFQAVEQIIKRECGLDPAIVTSVLKAALAEVSRTDRIVVKVNPQDVSAVQMGKEFWAPVNARLSEVRIEEDGRVERGGCIIESSSGTVDARMSTQLIELRETFLRCWEQGAGSVS